MQHWYFVELAVFLTVALSVQGQLPLHLDPDDGDFLSSPGKGSDSSYKYPNSIVKASEPSDDQSLAWRLPREVIPSFYQVRISPVLDAGQEAIVDEQWFVPGVVDITVQAQKASSHIVLHSKNITISNIIVTQGSTDIPVVSHAFEEHDFLNITLGTALVQGQTYIITIAFRSYITTDLNGLYRSSYVNPDTGDRVWLATTQMEALHARQMFPCFDEPALKSVFNFTIGRMNKYISLFCTESTGTTPGPTGWTYETYAPTVRMSTYLLAVIISEFTFEQAPGNVLPGKTIRTYAPDHYIKENGGVYAAENAEKLLSFFGSHLGVAYPLSKMDSAAVPDFFFGAMENYGLNIYRETALLVFPDRSLESERWSVTSILAHELAHQWFGNNISPAWWTHIWLNEGFATYFAAIGAEHTNPEYEPRKRFQNDAMQRSMESVVGPGYTHPVKIGEEEWATRGAMDWFGRVIYEQAGSLIRMMDSFLTTSVFTAGLKIYLNNHDYESAQQDDLFSALNLVAEIGGSLPANLTMKDIMDTWTLKSGYPLVRVSRASADRIFVSQEKFSLNAGGLSATNAVEDELWHIPISVATKASPNFDPRPEQWLDKNVAVTSWDVDATQWVILNAGAIGYYRVLYDLPLTTLIKEQLDADSNVVEELTRSQLLDDYFTFAYQRHLGLGTALSLTTYLANEDKIVVWNAVLKHLRKPLNLLAGESYANLKAYLLPRIKGGLNLTGGIEADFDDRAGMPVLRHQQFLDWACAMEDAECQDYAVAKVDDWRTTGNNTIRRDFHQILYCSAVAKGSDTIFQFIKEQYNATTTTAVQRRYLLNALGCTMDTGFINELLEGSVTTTYFQSTADGSTILQRLAMTPVGRPIVLRYIREHADAMATHFGSATPIASVFTTTATYANTQVELQDLETIATEIADTVIDVKPTIDASLTTVRGNIAWVAEFADSFNAFFGGN